MDSIQTAALFQTAYINYARNSRAIAVLWCVFTVCFSIINIVVFLQPWLGDSEETANDGYFGLFESCKYKLINQNLNIFTHSTGNGESEKSLIKNLLNEITASSNHLSGDSSRRLVCEGSWSNIATSVNPSATFFIGFSALINLVCIACFLVLFLFISSAFVFTLCGVLQLISTLCMILGCVIYPNNWDTRRITDICETSSRYNVGKCEIRWAFILALIGIFDILSLSILALVLSRRQANVLKVTSGVCLNDSSTFPRFADDDLNIGDVAFN